MTYIHKKMINCLNIPLEFELSAPRIDLVGLLFFLFVRKGIIKKGEKRRIINIKKMALS